MTVMLDHLPDVAKVLMSDLIAIARDLEASTGLPVKVHKPSSQIFLWAVRELLDLKYVVSMPTQMRAEKDGPLANDDPHTIARTIARRIFYKEIQSDKQKRLEDEK
jgi:hypothetical protein